jgi:hypothetical protein
MEIRWLGIFSLNHLSKRGTFLHLSFLLIFFLFFLSPQCKITECNKKLFIADKFVPKMLCLCWDPHPQIQELAKDAIKMLLPIDPPSLLDIQ